MTAVAVDELADHQQMMALAYAVHQPSSANGSISFLSVFLSMVVRGIMSFNNRDGVVRSLPGKL